LLAIAVVVAVGVAGPSRAGADTEEGARKHAAKANQLAAKNKCKAAIFEFTRAYKTLKDPTLLFNRAECFRKVGRDEEAINDYEQFLAEMPQTPNRAAVEARVASLRGTTAAPPVARKEPTAAPAKATAASTVKQVEKVPVAPTKEPAAPAAKPAVAPAKEPEPPVVKPAVVPAKVPVAAAAKPADKPAAAPAKAPVAPAAKPMEKAPAEPVRRAEKWTD
jgi:tetratricopeptide (TPR) repeat protein